MRVMTDYIYMGRIMKSGLLVRAGRMNGERKITARGNVMGNVKRNCSDCFHCKVSKKSTENCRLCFCAEIGKKVLLDEVYWLKKPVCRKFEDMNV